MRIKQQKLLYLKEGIEELESKHNAAKDALNAYYECAKRYGVDSKEVFIRHNMLVEQLYLNKCDINNKLIGNNGLDGLEKKLSQKNKR